MDANSEPDIIQIHPPVVDEREEGIYLYFHDMPPILLECPYIIPPEDDDEGPDDDDDQTTD